MAYFSTVVTTIAAFVALGSAAGRLDKHGMNPFGHDHGHEHDRAIGMFAYDSIANVAKDIHKLKHDSSKELASMHTYQMLDSPTAMSREEYSNKVNYIKSLGGEECLGSGEEAALKDFNKRQAEVVFDCTAGWRVDAELGTLIQTTMKALQDLDKKAKEDLGDCKPGQNCYIQFKRSTLGQDIEKQILELKQGPMVDIKVLSDVNRLQEMNSVSKCIADATKDLRKDIYSGIAKMNVCAASIGLLPHF